MPQEIDQDALDSPNLKVLDISKPPTRAIAHKEFPKMVYLHPKDKTREHRTKVVHTADEQDAAAKEGWREKPHIPVAPADPELAEFEYEDDSAVRGEEEQSAVDLNAMTKPQLVAFAAEHEIAIDAAAKKDVILAAINAALESEDE